jgi:tetratricopeptide (TPR) repeat protein
MAKPMPLTLPFLLLLLDWWPLARWSPTPGAPPYAEAPALRLLPPARLWIEKLPLFLLAAASAAVTIVAQARGGAVVNAVALPPPVRLANALIGAATYLLRTLRPLDLSVFYPHPTLLPPWWRWAGALAALAALTLVAVIGTRRRPWLATGWLWYLGSLVPVIGLVQVGAQATADRYTYLPLTGIFIAAAWSFGEAAGRGPRRTGAVAALACAVLLALAAFTARQVALWRSGVVLFGRALAIARRVDPRTGFTPDREGGRPPTAEELRLNPPMAFLENVLGLALAESGDLDGAVRHFRLSLEAVPHYSDALLNLGRALELEGRPEEALALYREAADGDARNVEARNNLGGALLAAGKPGEAEPWFREALAIRPDDAPSLSNLGIALAALGRDEEAERQFRAAVGADPRYAPGLFNLGRFLASHGRAPEAVVFLQEAARLRPDRADVRGLLEQVLAHAADTGLPPGAARRSR